MGTVADLHNFFTDRTGDVLVSSDYVRWPKAQRYRFYTTAQREFIRDADWLKSTVAATITSAGVSGNGGLITFSAATGTGYGLNKTDVYKVVNCWWDGELLEPITKREMNDLNERWRTETASDPTHYNLDAYGDGTLWLYPTPNADSGASGFRMDYVPAPAAFAADSDTISVTDSWIDAIGYLALALAHETETDPDMLSKAAMFRQAYQGRAAEALRFRENNFGQVPKPSQIFNF